MSSKIFDSIVLVLIIILCWRLAQNVKLESAILEIRTVQHEIIEDIYYHNEFHRRTGMAYISATTPELSRHHPQGDSLREYVRTRSLNRIPPIPASIPAIATPETATGG